MDTNKFVNRHVGIAEEDIPAMLEAIGVKSVDELIDQTIPANIRLKEPLNLPEPMTEREFAEHIAELASKNEVFTSYIGMGWYDTICPAPIQRNVFENPVWYTSYTPYQAEVSQGRLEALLNFQTVISELTGSAANQLFFAGRSDCCCRSCNHVLRKPEPCTGESRSQYVVCRRKRIRLYTGRYQHSHDPARHQRSLWVITKHLNSHRMYSELSYNSRMRMVRLKIIKNSSYVPMPVEHVSPLLPT